MLLVAVVIVGYVTWKPAARSRRTRSSGAVPEVELADVISGHAPTPCSGSQSPRSAISTASSRARVSEAIIR